MSRHSAAQGLGSGGGGAIPPGWPASALPPESRRNKPPTTNSIPQAYRPQPVPGPVGANDLNRNWNYGLGYDDPYDYGYKKTKKGKSCFGNGVDWDDVGYTYEPYPYRQPGYPKLPKKPKNLQVQPTYGSPLPLPNPNPNAIPGGDYGPTGIPDPPPPKIPPFKLKVPTNWPYLSKKQRKIIIKENKAEEKQWNKVRKEQVNMWKESVKHKRKEEKALFKREEKDRKQREKEMIWKLKHPPSNGAPLPVPDLGPKPSPAAAAPASAAPVPNKGPDDPLTFMLLPTMEEFGVRRPFDGAPLPPALGGPGREGWPMMSRTMTHAIVDMSREERVHAISKGVLSVPNW